MHPASGLKATDGWCRRPVERSPYALSEMLICSARERNDDGRIRLDPNRARRK